MCNVRPVRCKVDAENVSSAQSVSKRGVLVGLGMAAVLAIDVVKPSTSWALLPDDDDVDLVQKAKASRQRKLQVCRGLRSGFLDDTLPNSEILMLLLCMIPMRVQNTRA